MAIIDALTEHLTSRFKKVLSDPVLMATVVFDYAKWPGADQLEGFGAAEIKLLFGKYKGLYTITESTTEADVLADVLSQWEEMKTTITTAPGLFALSFHALWARMLTKYSDKYPLVLRLVVVMLLIPCDTSECERVFSLMNDLKTAERNRVGQKNLKNLMIWHSIAKKLSFVELPVVAILEEFRRLGGPRGRNAHRPTAPPKHNYIVKVEEGEAPAPAPTPAPAPVPTPAPA